MGKVPQLIAIDLDIRSIPGIVLRIKARARERRPKQVVEAAKRHGTLRSEPLQCGMNREDSQPGGVAHVCVCYLRTEVEAEGA